MEKIPAAIIGLGRIASLLEDDAKREKPCTHAGALAANPDCVLAGGFDIDEDRRQIFGERWNVPVFESAAGMLRAAKPKILVIATHPDSHYFYCRAAAEAGVPVVICEKPLADNLRSARKIARLAKQGSRGVKIPGERAGAGIRGANIAGGHGLTVITNHERRYSADYLKAKEILASGRLGKILSVHAILYMGRNKRLLDVFWHDGTHLADAVMFLSGLKLRHRRRWGAKLSSTAGTAWLEGELFGEEVRTGAARYTPPPIPALMEVGAGRDHLAFETEFSCEKGRLRIGNRVFEVWESAECPYAENFRSLKSSGEFFTGPTGYFTNMIADAALCVKEKGRVPISSAADGLSVIEYLHSVKPWHKST